MLLRALNIYRDFVRVLKKEENVALFIMESCLILAYIVETESLYSYAMIETLDACFFRIRYFRL